MHLTRKLVLVTGGNGFIGSHVVKSLLEHVDSTSTGSNIKGATVRAVVRTPSKGDALKAVFPSYADKIETPVVENMEAHGAYDDVVKDVDVVIHMASPLPGTSAANNEAGYLIPAREGILGMLRSASKSPSVKRVVITTSSAAVLDSSVPADSPYILSASQKLMVDVFGRKRIGAPEPGKMV
jgi:nucleoside-diphosphate-sugar epimerase